MELENQQKIYTKINDILASDNSALGKVQQIVKLGFDEEEADTLVERYQNGHNQVFYEELPKAEYSRDEEEELLRP